MEFFINEKLFSLHDKFYILDSNGNNIYEISSKVFSIGDKITIRDMSGNEILYVEQQLFHLMPHYNVFADGQLICSISKKFKLFANNYHISNDFYVKGNFFGFNFAIYDSNNLQIGSISRKFLTLGDKYVLVVNDLSNIKIILGIIVAIAMDINRNQNNSNS